MKVRAYLTLMLVLSIAVWTLAAADAGNSSTAMPKPAPSFKRATVSKRAVEKNNERSVFRVQTSEESPASPRLEAQALSYGQKPLQGELAIKTSPAQVGGSKPAPPSMFRVWLEQAHPDFALTCSQYPATNVVEVRGVYDNAGKTLQSLGIPFRPARGADLVGMPLSQMKVVVVDCPGRVPAAAYEKLREFVSGGGYLLTTDWSSDNVIQGAFPGYIEWDRHKNDKSIYDAHTVNPDSLLFKRTVSNASWKMDIDAHMIRILRPEVRIIAASDELAAEDPLSKGALAVVFPFGKGYVMHMVGHFDNNTAMSFRHMLADPAPLIGISLRQALAANFVVAGLSGSKIKMN